jgi:hypothetical protein
VPGLVKKILSELEEIQEIDREILKQELIEEMRPEILQIVKEATQTMLNVAVNQLQAQVPMKFDDPTYIC